MAMMLRKDPTLNYEQSELILIFALPQEQQTLHYELRKNISL
jgi:hypothetical protein